MRDFLHRHPLIHAISAGQLFFFAFTCFKAGMGPVAVVAAWMAYTGIDAMKLVMERSGVIKSMTDLGEYFPDLTPVENKQAEKVSAAGNPKGDSDG